ncbi:MAG: HAMP domain-containing sensor histidine kinase [Cognaticolwellia sp.]
MRTLEQQLPDIIKSLSSTYGNAFFNELTLQLNKFIDADYTFIARLDAEKNTSKTISLVAKGQLADNFEYSLASTPCADIGDDSVCIFPQDICSLYPDDQLLIDMNIQGYVGVPLHNSIGDVMGIIVALHENKIVNQHVIVTVFELFAGRISAEIERTEKEAELNLLTKSLERKVMERTSSLSTALKQLELTQKEIIAKEKMAALGLLVAGVAHEINSPLGVAILGASVVEETSYKLHEKLNNSTLSKEDLSSGFTTILSSVKALNFNLHRAAELVHSFKEVAVDRSTDDIREFILSTWIHELINSLMPMLNKKSISVKLELPEQPIIITTCTSKLGQVLSNLITNASIHAFPKEVVNDNKLITIKINEVNDNVHVFIQDNGVGVEQKNIEALFDPFFTTNRSEGNTGLGLSISRNIMTESLQGSIDMTSVLEQGSEFRIILPKVIAFSVSA